MFRTGKFGAVDSHKELVRYFGQDASPRHAPLGATQAVGHAVVAGAAWQPKRVPLSRSERDMGRKTSLPMKGLVRGYLTCRSRDQLAI